MKKSLRVFNPVEVAELELRMWQAYYTHRFVHLFFLLAQLLRKTFGFGFFTTIRAAYHAATAVAIFRLKKGKETPEDEKKIIKHLNNLYRLVLKHSLETFDYQEVAALELKWWFIDRYPTRYKITRAAAIAEATARLYSVKPTALEEHAALRAQAMELQDESDLTGHTDWETIGSLLQASYKSLAKAIQ